MAILRLRVRLLYRGNIGNNGYLGVHVVHYVKMMNYLIYLWLRLHLVLEYDTRRSLNVNTKLF